MTTGPDGTRVNYIVEGSGAPLVLVGGKTSSIESAWWRYIPVLSERLKIVALDNRGAGASDKPDEPYTTAGMAEDALAVLRAAGESSAHWFGISLGGMILQQLAIAHPEAVRSLILVATHCGGEAIPPPNGELDVLAQNPLRRYRNLYATRFILDHPDWVAQDAMHFGKMPLHAIHRQDQAVRSHNLCARLREIDQPVLLLHGRQDRMVPVERAEQLLSALPNARLRILDPAGHQVHSEQFTAVLALVLEFIDDVESARNTQAVPGNPRAAG